MIKQIKKLISLGMVVCLSVSSSMIVYAGQWQEDETGRWYQNDDGSYPTNTWKEIDGAYYYFWSDGYTTRPCSTFEGVNVPLNGMGWIPESNDVNGKENALTIVGDMG